MLASVKTSVRPMFSADELSEIFEHIPAVVWACNRNLRFTFSVGAALNKLGLRPQQVVGTPVADFLKGAPVGEVVLKKIERALRGEPSVYEVHWGNVTFESHIEPLFNRAGEVTGVVGIALDITERLSIQEELVLSHIRLAHTSALFPVTHFVVDASGMITLLPEHRELLGLPDSATNITFDDVLAIDRKSTRLNSSHYSRSRMPSSA